MPVSPDSSTVESVAATCLTSRSTAFITPLCATIASLPVSTATDQNFQAYLTGKYFGSCRVSNTVRQPNCFWSRPPGVSRGQRRPIGRRTYRDWGHGERGGCLALAANHLVHGCDA